MALAAASSSSDDEEDGRDAGAAAQYALESPLPARGGKKFYGRLVLRHLVTSSGVAVRVTRGTTVLVRRAGSACARSAAACAARRRRRRRRCERAGAHCLRCAAI